MLFSDNLQPYKGSLSVELESVIKEIKEYFKVDDIEILSYDKYSIVIIAEFKISLPSRGSVDNLIRPIEPILIKLPLTGYPDLGPVILPNRLDFPKTRLSHLYIAKDNYPPALCLARGDFNEWFASMRIADFLYIGEVWFFKAATGTLNDDNDEFDPTLLEKNDCSHVYKYEVLNQIVNEDDRLVEKFPMAVILGYLTADSPLPLEKYSLTSIKGIPLLGLSQLNEVFPSIAKTVVSADVFPLYSLLVWDPDNKVESNYATRLPENYGQLKKYLSFSGIHIEEILSFAEENNFLFRRIIPIIHAVKRPKKLIGLAGDYEFFSYIIILPELGLKDLNNDSKIFICNHTEPFSQKLAQTMSNEKREQKNLYVGAGSLGSKMIMHDARSGNLNIGVVDHDVLEQHNLARHALFANKVRQNKASAIIGEIKGFYLLDNTSGYIAYEERINSVDKETLSLYNHIVDSTASRQVLNYMTEIELSDALQYTRCEIADDGELGLLYSEGTGRNPRIDDLSNLAIYKATEDEDLELWRMNDAKKEVETVNIGQGCSSTTTIMPDDTISYHASVFSRIINMDIGSGVLDRKGVLYMNIKRENGSLPFNYSKVFYVEAFDIFFCKAGSGWQIRMLGGLSKKLIGMCNERKPNETGGILIGVANYKTKVIHIFDFLAETADSFGSPTRFIRGTEKLPEQIEKIKLQTGNVMGYIGEWHTHPMNLEQLSGQDMESIEKLKKINAETPIPTCAIIVTQTQILPFIYE